MGTDLQKAQPEFLSFLDKKLPAIIQAMPLHNGQQASDLEAKRFMALIYEQFRKTPALQACAPATIFNSVVQIAGLGLEPGGVLGEAYLIPYKTTCTMQLGYQGLKKIALRNPKLKKIIAKEVYEGDIFDFDFGLEPKLIHKPCPASKRGAIIAYYAAAFFSDGEKQFEVMYQDDIDDLRKKTVRYKSDAWENFPTEMALKTVIKKLCRQLPRFDQFNVALAIDDAGNEGRAVKIIDNQIIDIDAEGQEIHPAAQGEDALDRALQPTAKEIIESATSDELRAALDSVKRDNIESCSAAEIELIANHIQRNR